MKALKKFKNNILMIILQIIKRLYRISIYTFITRKLMNFKTRNWLGNVWIAIYYIWEFINYKDSVYHLVLQDIITEKIFVYHVNKIVFNVILNNVYSVIVILKCIMDFVFELTVLLWHNVIRIIVRNAIRIKSVYNVILYII